MKFDHPITLTQNQTKKYLILQRYFPMIISWQDLRYANGTFEEWVKKSEEEFAAIDEEIREIRQLLDETS